jgi:hypothetical protein
MKISGTMVRALLSPVVTGYFDDHEDLPGSVAEIADDARNIRIAAERSGDLPWLKLALGHLLSGPAAPLAAYTGATRRLSAEEMAELLSLVWRALWPDEPIPARGSGPDVELEPMEAQAWLEYRAAVYGG